MSLTCKDEEEGSGEETKNNKGSKNCKNSRVSEEEGGRKRMIMKE